MAAETDFGIRELGKPVRSSEPPPGGRHGPSHSGRSVDMADIKQIGARWGQVTSTYPYSRRTTGDVGGVANSYHLRNRAIDIARRPGVSHGQIAAAYRNAGYSLAELLDEGDHSHFAFGASRRMERPAGRRWCAVKSGEKTEWRIVYAPPSSSSAGGN